MSAHPDPGRLNEYVDGALAPSDSTALELHLAECGDCRSEVEALSSLLSRAATLERSIEPERDLWPAIAADIERQRTVELMPGMERPGATLWRYRYPLAAAAALLVTLSSVGTLVLTRDAPMEPQTAAAPQPAATQGAAPVSFAGQQDYHQAIGALQETLAERSAGLDPETVETVRRNLAIIDAAIRDARAALAADPGNGELTRTVAEAYKTKLQLLRRAVELPART